MILYFCPCITSARWQMDKSSSWLHRRDTYCRQTDEDMTPSDMTIDYKVSSFLHVHGNFWYTWLDSTNTCHYLIVGTNASQSAIPSKLNIWFAGRPTILHWEGDNSFLRSEFGVNGDLMERLFYKLSNASDIISISRWEDLQIIKICCCCFWWVLRHRRGHVIHTWDPGPSWRTLQRYGEEFEDARERPPPWSPP